MSSSYHATKDVLRTKLQSLPSKIHLSADGWSVPNHKAFLGIFVKFVDPDAKGLLQALLALSELPGLDGLGSHGGVEQWKLLRRALRDYLAQTWFSIRVTITDRTTSCAACLVNI